MTPPISRHIEPIGHLVPELKSLLDGKQYDLLKDLLADLSPVDLADSWYQFSRDQRTEFFKLLETRPALVLFESLSIEDRAHLMKSLEETNAASVLDSLPSKDVAQIFHKLPRKAVRRMVSLLKKEEAVEKINLLMTFAPNTAGSLMHPEFVKLGSRMTAKAAVTLLQTVSRADKKHLVRALYVTTPEGRAVGALELEQLIAAPPDSQLQECMTSVEPYKVTPETDQERIAFLFSKYNLRSAPVVDENDKLLGTIQIDDIIEVVNAEATEDIAKMAGTRADELRVRSIFRVAWFRAPWLLATLATQVVVSFVMNHFRFVLQEVLALATFLPLVAAMGGNVGSQSAIIFVRSVALGRLKGSAKYFAVLKEAGTGLILGIGYGVAVAGIAYVLYGRQLGLEFVFVVGGAVCIAMVWASIAGACGPILFEKLGIDPATAVGPMITTLTDLFSISVYFALACVFLIGRWGP